MGGIQPSGCSSFDKFAPKLEKNLKLFICVLFLIFETGNLSAFGKHGKLDKKHESQSRTVSATFIDSQVLVNTNFQSLFSWLKKEIPELDIKGLTEKGARTLLTNKETDIVSLPVLLIDREVENAANFSNFIRQKLLIKKGDRYLLSKESFGFAEFINRQRVENIVDVFIMAQCPYGASFLNDLIRGVRQKKLPGIEIRNIYYLVDLEQRLEIVQNDDKLNQKQVDYYFKSRHGISEVEESQRQLVMKKYYLGQFFDYLLCRNVNINSSLWPDCLIKNGINFQQFNHYYRQEGKQLLIHNILEQEKLDIKISPTLLWENRIAIWDMELLNQIPKLQNLEVTQIGFCR